MTFTRDDLIEFTNGERVVVLESTIYEEKEYLMCVLLKDKSDEPSDTYRIYYVNYEIGQVEKVTDETLANYLFVVMNEKLKKDA